MDKIKCTFHRPEQASVDDLWEIVVKLDRDFSAICSGEASPDDICRYAGDLVDLARPLESDPRMYFLGLIDPKTAPADGRVYLFYLPTYLASSIIIKGSLASTEFLFDRLPVVQGVLLASTGRRFEGSGYDWLKEKIAVMRIFLKAGTDLFLEKYGVFFPEFKKLYEASFDTLEVMVKEGRAHSVWGTDYSDEAMEILSLRRQMLQSK